MAAQGGCGGKPGVLPAVDSPETARMGVDRRGEKEGKRLQEAALDHFEDATLPKARGPGQTLLGLGVMKSNSHDALPKRWTAFPSKGNKGDPRPVLRESPG